MKIFSICLFFLFVLCVVQGADNDGFVSIFDGQTLKGWEATPAKTASAWTVNKGMIVGNGDKGRGYLTYTLNKNIADLELKFSYQTGLDINLIPVHLFMIILRVHPFI